MFVVQEQAAPRPIPVWQGHSALPGHQAGHGAAGTDRFAERQEDLAPEDVEEVGWSGAVHDDPVALIELTHVKVIQLLSRPARVRGFHETHGTSWPRGSSSRERSGPQPSLLPSLPFLPSLPSLSRAHRDRWRPGRGSRAVPATLVWPWGWPATPSHATFRATST